MKILKQAYDSLSVHKINVLRLASESKKKRKFQKKKIRKKIIFADANQQSETTETRCLSHFIYESIKKKGRLKARLKARRTI
jgi:hypothetical protein